MLRVFCLLYVLLSGFMSGYGQEPEVRRVAILDIVDNGSLLSDGVKLLVRSRLSAAIANTPGYASYDRADIASIIDEHEFQRTGLVDDYQIKKLGEMTGADYILVTEVAEFDDSNIVMIAKILDVESAKLERISDVTTATDIDALDKNCRELIRKLLTVRQELEIGDNVYVGECANGVPNGQGVMRFSINDPKGRKVYRGSWLNGKCQGKGTMTYIDGVYVGNFYAGEKNGFGVYHYPDGSRYEGNWSNDKMHGNGRFFYSNEDSDKRNFVNGHWENGVMTGEGCLFYKDGSYMKGMYLNDRMEDEWRCYDVDGQLVATKIFKNGKLAKTRKSGKR